MLFNGRALICTFSRTQVRIAEIELHTERRRAPMCQMHDKHVTSSCGLYVLYFTSLPDIMLPISAVGANTMLPIIISFINL